VKLVHLVGFIIKKLTPVIHQAMLHYADTMLGYKTLFFKQFFSLRQSCVSKEETPNTL